MDPFTIKSASIHGPTLSMILQSLLAGGRECDGLLFGSFRTARESRFNDDDQEPIINEEHKACISAAVCCASTCSFFNAVGEVDEERLCSSVPPAGSQEPMVGWLSYRHSSPLHPSMREAASCGSLYQHAAAKHARSSSVQLPPLLFLLVTSHQEKHAGATLTFEYKLFQISSTPAQLKSAMPVQPPVELAVTMHGVALTVINLAEGLGHQAAYKTFDPVHQLPSINLAQGSSGGADGLHVPAHVQLQQSIEAAVNASAQQVSGLEAHFDDVLRQTSRLMHKVMDEAPALRQIRSENASLLQELDKLSA
mmetsp:Transcript_26014/g.77148  ORF Transcript_26014/g.77148 Transcript_26014/m.77148 type:complete len:309 (-) Transcript_26014:111-1037(-)